MRLDAAHNPVLADYWRNDSDDNLTSDSSPGDVVTIQVDFLDW